MDTIALINAVKAHPELYGNPLSASSIDQKTNTWRDISEIVSQPVAKCKAKWRNLRDSYLKAMKWKEELAEVGKLSRYREYKHEDALSFLGNGQKRKLGEYDRRTRMAKRPRTQDVEEIFDTVDATAEQISDYSPSAAVEFLMESQDATQQDDVEEEEEQEVHEQLTQEIEEQFEPQMVEVAKQEIDDTQYLTYESTTITEQEDGSYQNPNEGLNQRSIKESREIDSWLAGVKSTLLFLPRILRARAKRQINELVSDMEIKYLESIDASRS